MDYSTTLYKILSEIKHSKSISEVATKLFISQPYVSKIIKQAEEKYDVLIVDRKKPISLTKAGVIILDGLRLINEQESEINYKVSAYRKNNKFEVKIALNQPWLTVNPLSLIKYLKNQYPEITFSFFTQTTNIAQDNLLTHSTDIFIGKMLINSKITSSYLFDSKLYFVIPDNSPLFEETENELSPRILKKFSNLDFISLTDDSFFQTMIDHMFEEREVKLNKIIKVSNTIIATKLAIDGLGYTITMKNLAEQLASESSKKIKLIHIPVNQLQLSIGISHLNNANPLIQNIAKDLSFFFRENDIFN